MILKILLILLLLLIIWILFMPLMLQVDSTTGRYRFMLPGVLSAAVIPSDEIFYIRIWFFFIPFRINPVKMALRGKNGKRSQSNRKKDKSKKKRKNIFENIGNGRKFSKVLRAIRIRKFDLDIDTDDFLLNAYLVPAFSLVNNQDNLNMRVNFEGNFILNMDVRTRIGAILWILMTTRNK